MEFLKKKNKRCFYVKKFPKTLNGKLKEKRSIKIFQIRYSVQMITYKSEKH